ncbi:acyltransferase [Blastococcus jejuensis]
MAIRPGRGPAPSRQPATAAARHAYLDNLKVLLIAAIIAAHALIGYSDLGGNAWAYSEVRETTLAEPTFVVLVVVAFPFGIFLIALLFLVAGLLTSGSYDRKGAGRFVHDRLLRLGAPYVVGTLLLWPALNYALYRPLGYERGSYWDEFVRDVPTGSVMWFAAVLLVLSLGYAGLRRWRPERARTSRPISLRALLLLAAAVAAVSFLVRLASPYNSWGLWGLHAWQWPECLAAFALGAIAAGQGWLVAVPEPVRRHARTATLLGALGLAVFIALPLGFPIDYAAGGWHWQAAVAAALEGVLTVFGPVWLLAVAQRRLARPLPHGTALARSSYGAFVLQGVFLYGTALALRPVPVPAEVKAVTVALASVIGSFAVSWLLISRVPALRRVL